MDGVRVADSIEDRVCRGRARSHSSLFLGAIGASGLIPEHVSCASRTKTFSSVGASHRARRRRRLQLGRFDGWRVKWVLTHAVSYIPSFLPHLVPTPHRITSKLILHFTSLLSVLCVPSVCVCVLLSIRLSLCPYPPLILCLGATQRCPLLPLQ
jgi:hypothetical protein